MKKPLLLRRVTGDSMLPTLKNGQIVIGFTWRHKHKAGDIVILRHKGLEKIKRIHKITKQGVEVRGDNQRASTDSRAFGVIKTEDILAKVVHFK